MDVRDISRHPCFNREASGGCARIHLPVAPKCNVLCNFCNRKYDCVNESRPGVTSAVLSPMQALHYLNEVMARETRLSVVGIAGPGDPFANPEETLQTLRLIRKNYPDLLLCVATNGLGLSEHVETLAEIGLTHLTVTVNAVNPEIGKKVYAWVRDGNVVFRGLKAAELILSRQIEAVKRLKRHGIMLKINSILIPGVNDFHIPEISARMADLGADLMNVIPMYPAKDTPFAAIAEPDKESLAGVRSEAGRHMPQMTHCKRCRADAVGLLREDRSQEFEPLLKTCSRLVTTLNSSRPYVAVTTREGMLVNEHLGEAQRFQIWNRDNVGYVLVEEREAPKAGCGAARWEKLADILHDCRAVLVQALGESPRLILEKKGLTCHECSGFIENALAAVYGCGDLAQLSPRRKGLAGGCGCSGKGVGCG